MNTHTIVSLVATFALTSGAIAQTPSLTELAKAEKARRAKIQAKGEPAKLYTEGDRSGLAIPPPQPVGVVGDTAAVAPTGPDKTAKEKTPQELAAEKQQEWADRVKKTQDEIKALEEVIARNERTLASMYNITPARADMAAAIESDKQKLAALRQTLVDLEDERRRAGIPRLR